MIKSQVKRSINSLVLLKIGRHIKAYIFIVFKKLKSRAKSQVQMIKRTE